MTSNRLKPNPTKTVFMLCATSHMQRLVDRARFIVQGVLISPSPSVRLLGVLIDSELTLTDQVSSTLSSCFYQLRCLRSLRRSISLEAAKSVVNAFVISRVDYANGLLAGSDRRQIERWQRGCKYDHVTPIIRDKLHWLRVQQRIKYKLCLLVHKAFYQRSPSYIKELVVPVSQDATTRLLRSADTQSLITPRTAKLIGDRGFFVDRPSVWNNLPVQLRQTLL